MSEIYPLYDKNITCPCCTRTFHTKKVRVRQLKTDKIDSDYCTHFQHNTIDPYYYYVYVCCHCGYSFSDTFTKKLTASTKEVIEKNLSVKWKEKDYGIERSFHVSIQTYKLALFTAKLTKERHIVIAGLCLRLSWIYRKEKQLKEEQHFLHYATNAYIDSYMNNDFEGTEMTELKILYMIGELSRRIRNYNQSIEYFSKIIKHPLSTQDRAIVEKAREQWYLAREEAGMQYSEV